MPQQSRHSRPSYADIAPRGAHRPAAAPGDPSHGAPHGSHQGGAADRGPGVAGLAGVPSPDAPASRPLAAAGGHPGHGGQGGHPGHPAQGAQGSRGGHGAGRRGKSRHIPALDGLRAFAVLAVIAYHMGFDWAPGGLLGVTMFFVLSGYLITGLLLKEYSTTRTISLKGFWVRRVRRIIPAVLFCVLGTGLLCAIFDPALLTKMRPDIVPTLLFVNNWWQIFHNVSYFEALGEPSPLTHCWSLSIEEQFYLIWPVLLLVLLKLGVRKKALRNLTLVLAVLSAAEMALLFNPYVDPSRIYYGTDTRAFSLLIGSFLAFVWPYQRLTERAGEAMSTGGRLVFNLVGVAAVAGLVAMVALTNGFAPFIYQGGLLLCSVLTAVAIAVMVHPISWLGKVLGWAPLVFIGKISYSMYLWHFPLILLMTPNNLVGDPPLWLCLVQFVVIVAVTCFSYFVIENPIHKGAIGKVLEGVRQQRYTLGQWLRGHLAGAIVVAAFLVGSVVAIVVTPAASAVEGPGVMRYSVIDRTVQSVQRQKLFVEAEREANRPDVLLIGDSVPESMYGYGTFGEIFPTGYIDAAQGRQFYMAPDVYRTYKDAGMVGDVVVFALGTNGYATDEEFDRLMAEVGPDQQVWFVNTRSPEDYMAESNATIQRGVDRYGNAHLIDWCTFSEDKDDLFDGDGTHLTADASKTYGQLIYDAVKEYLPEDALQPPPADEGAGDEGDAGVPAADDEGAAAGDEAAS